MKHANESLLEDGTMAADYTPPAPEKIQIGLSIMDNLAFPIERRGFSTNIPRNPDDRAAVAKALGETAEKTARLLMGLSPEVSA